MSNLFKVQSGKQNKEEILDLWQKGQVRIERIVSYGQSSPPDFWYSQETEEWVCLLKGKATLLFEDTEVLLSAGDYLHIPKQVKHRVDAVSDDAIWLAIHIQ